MVYHSARSTCETYATYIHGRELAAGGLRRPAVRRLPGAAQRHARGRALDHACAAAFFRCLFSVSRLGVSMGGKSAAPQMASRCYYA